MKAHRFFCILVQAANFVYHVFLFMRLVPEMRVLDIATYQVQDLVRALVPDKEQKHSKKQERYTRGKATSGCWVLMVPTRQKYRQQPPARFRKKASMPIADTHFLRGV